MTKPTPSTATPKRGAASGTKRNPPTALAGDGGLQSSSTNELEHKEILPAQEQTHNTNNDRVGIKNLDEAQESRNPPSRDSRGVSKDKDGSASEADFNRDQWTSQVFSETDALHSSSKLILLALGHLFNERGECWPTQTHLAEMTGLGLRTVITHLNDLEAAGWLETDRNVRIDGKRGILYRALRH